jgi:hypothetical protein
VYLEIYCCPGVHSIYIERSVRIIKLVGCSKKHCRVQSKWQNYNVAALMHAKVPRLTCEESVQIGSKSLKHTAEEREVGSTKLSILENSMWWNKGSLPSVVSGGLYSACDIKGGRRVFQSFGTGLFSTIMYFWVHYGHVLLLLASRCLVGELAFHSWWAHSYLRVCLVPLLSLY